MGLFFKFGQAVLEIFEFSCSKEGVFLDKTEEGTYLPDMAPKRRFFCKFLGINTHNFVKNYPNFESKGLFDVKLYGS